MKAREQIVQLHACPNCGALVSPFMKYKSEKKERRFLMQPMRIRFWHREPVYTSEGVCPVCGQKRTDPPPEERTPVGRLM